MTIATKEADIVVMAAAPADFAPASTSETKIKKTGDAGLRINLVQTSDVLAGLAAGRNDPRQVLVGFAAETPDADHSLLDLGRAKLERKGCDLLVLNEVGHGLVFGQPDSAITLLTAEGVGATLTGSKDTLAHRIWDAALALRSGR